jgi:hypothetical protein
MKIHAPFHAWLRSFPLLMFSGSRASDAVISIQDSPDCFRGTRQLIAQFGKHFILLQVV